MKIAIVSGDDVVGEDPEQLGVALTAQGHDATVCFRRNGPRPAKATAGACRSVAVPVGPRAAADAIDVLPYVGDWAAKLERVWSKEQPDVVHAYGWLGGLAAQLAARRRRVPVVQTFLGLTAASRAHDAASARRSERQRIEPLLARSAAWATGESSAEVDMLAQLRHSRARVSALTCGVDSERYTPTGPEIARDGLQRILCVAPNPLQHNGFDIAISALSRVPGAEVVIAETEATNTVHDDARAQLQYLAKEFGVADRVRFAGTIPGKEMPMWVRSADIMVCTPREPLRPSTALQAMASGVVVVAATVGALADVVLDDITGVVLPPENPVGLAAALRRLLAQRFQCESMGAAGRSRAQSRFAWERIALDALNVYQSLGAQGRASTDLSSTAAR
ncbi:glycosyltransferase [Mycobacterium intracellulare]|uniref:glycosyltransferase n=1 Tax=Mycobacterium intracellulare TaxID=1767 RepID=UPI0001B4618E|nr:glycosyltransferase [Mycobacterium intracellulare]MCA2355286.1 glycosyltransferase [Mycobacterium intracellulare]MCA2365757.1 glycosyltransferase [Mycobacterium intracellulare]UGT95485.1 glycosyltransferase [Mycobacterium intracellulare]UGU05057.1 glycosyltransferase [Mycobacterium intracellulare subsp. intracellulare]UQB96358.1 glycosyltransferase [Mycobacterium intracellulare]